MTYEEKKNIVIDNCFQQDCDINTTIKEAYTKGFNKGADKQRSVERSKIDAALKEIEDTFHVDSLILGELIDFREGKMGVYDTIYRFNQIARKEALEILKKHIGK